jgi:hypothetical protein
MWREERDATREKKAADQRRWRRAKQISFPPSWNETLGVCSVHARYNNNFCKLAERKRETRAPCVPRAYISFPGVLVVRGLRVGGGTGTGTSVRLSFYYNFY